jgi:hypothetical protein
MDATGELWRECLMLGCLLQRVPGIRGSQVSEGMRAVRTAFLEAVDGLAPGEQPPAEMVRRVRAAFYALPDAELRALFNGWSPSPEPRPLLRDVYDVRQQAGTQHVARALTFIVQPARTPGGSIAFGHEQCLAGHLAGVRVEIIEGATRADVLAALQKVAELVIASWPQLIDAERIGELAEGNAAWRPPAPAEAVAAD